MGVSTAPGDGPLSSLESRVPPLGTPGKRWPELELQEPQKVVSLAYEPELGTTTPPSLGHRLKMELCREEQGKFLKGWESGGV